ncbi:MAG: hypothetical protein BWY75_01980 [bacterium ADurb.Bin425]|nr:MAG: hypothetical protein BWY75_01980 [bacterium ADurb.Bin425]
MIKLRDSAIGTKDCLGANFRLPGHIAVAVDFKQPLGVSSTVFVGNLPVQAVFTLKNSTVRCSGFSHCPFKRSALMIFNLGPTSGRHHFRDPSVTVQARTKLSFDALGMNDTAIPPETGKPLAQALEGDREATGHGATG